MRPRPDHQLPRSPSDDPTAAGEDLAPDGIGSVVIEDDREPLPSRPRPSLTAIGVAGLTRRRVAWIIGLVLTAWIVVLFARQVGDASAKAAEADAARDANAQMAGSVAALQRELALVQRQEFVEQQAHGLGLGSDKDHPFAIAPNAPPLAANAPGSAAVRLGASPHADSPLESWLSLLFGPAPS